MILTYISDNGRSVTFGGASPYELNGVDGLHGLTADVHTFAQYLQDGTTYVASQLHARTISIWSKISRDVIPNRIALLQTVSPKDNGTLIIQRKNFTRQIRCVVEQAPSFPKENGVSFSCGLYAPSPFYEAKNETRQDVAAWEGGVKWPWSFPDGFTFGNRTESRVINVFNAGDVDVGMRVTFIANGTVTSPALVDVNTYKHIRVNADMVAGDRVEVNTTIGGKTVRLLKANGTTENAFDRFDPYSEFLQLKRGDNLFRFEAGTGGDVLDVTINYRTRYLGV